MLIRLLKHEEYLILVHQLVRQYVMATILIEISQNLPKKRIIPFVVGDKRRSLKKTYQVTFMIGQGWLSEENVLEWGDIEATIPKPLARQQ